MALPVINDLYKYDSMKDIRGIGEEKANKLIKTFCEKIGLSKIPDEQKEYAKELFYEIINDSRIEKIKKINLIRCLIKADINVDNNMIKEMLDKDLFYTFENINLNFEQFNIILNSEKLNEKKIIKLFDKTIFTDEEYWMILNELLKSDKYDYEKFLDKDNRFTFPLDWKKEELNYTNKKEIFKIMVYLRRLIKKKLTNVSISNIQENIDNSSFISKLIFKKNIDYYDLKFVIDNFNVDINVKDEYGKTPLHKASKKGYKEIVELLLDNGADVNVKDKYNEVPLSIAAEKGYKEIVKLLLKKGANPNIEDVFKKTALYKASKKGYKEIVELLLENRANPNIITDLNNTALLEATRNKHKEIVKILVNNGANINFRDSLGETALYYAIIHSDEDLVKFLLEKGADTTFNYLSSYKFYNFDSALKLTTLATAVRQNNINIVKLLLNKKQKKQEKEDNVSNHILMFAVNNNNKNMVELLLENGVDVNIKESEVMQEKHLDCYGSTALYYAAKNDNIEIVKLLIEKGADVNVMNDMKFTPLYEAIKNNNIEMAKLFIKKGADVNARNRIKNTPLYKAIQNGNIETVRLLIENGAEINIKDDFGFTPLLEASKNGNTEIIKLLLEKGADINVKTNYNSTPIYLAVYNNNIETIKILLKYGADVDNKDKEIAEKEGYTEIVKLLENKTGGKLFNRRLYK